MIVQCINNKDVEGELTMGRFYVCDDRVYTGPSGKMHYRVYPNDARKSFAYYYFRFKTIKEIVEEIK